MKKRILSMLLILCLVIGIISTAAFAASGVTVEIYRDGALSGTFSETNRYYHNNTQEINSDSTGANAVMDFGTNTLTLNDLELTGQIKVSGGGITVVLTGTNEISYSSLSQNWLIFCNDGDLAIEGPGSLELSSSSGASSAIHAGGTITISDGAKIVGTITNSAQVISGGNVIITGAGTSVKATATGSGSGINVANNGGTTLTVADGATLEAVSANGTALTGVATLSAAGSTVTVGESAPGSAWDRETDINTYKYVKIAPTTYTVTYDENGATSGSAPTDSNSPYNSGATVTVLGRPGGLDKDGYTFHCWNTTANGTGTDYSAGQTFTITENTTLYAKWEQVVNYDLWVGGVQVTSSNASNITGAGITGSVSYDNSTKTLTLNNANITGAYEHWNAMSAIYGKTDLTIDLIGNNTITGTENSASSYGIYIDDKRNTDNTGKLTFTGSGSLTVSAADAPLYWSVAVFANDTITVGDSCSITAYCGDDASTIRAFYSYASSNKYVLPSVPGILIAGNKNAPEAANFEVCDGNPNAFQYLRIALGYTVTLNKNGGTVNSGNVTCYFVDTGATLPTDVTKSGCEFVGWYDNAELTGEAVTAISATATGNKEYWAKWEQNAVSPAATPTIGTDLSSTEVTYDKDAAATALSITASVTDGGTLTYQWYKNDVASTDGAQAIDDATSTTYTPATSATGTTYYYCVITNTKDGQTATATSAIAMITVNEPAPATYTVTFDANGGSVTPASAATNAEGKLDSLPTPTRSGSYSFNGWYTATNGGTKVTTSTVFNDNTTIYAQWTYTGGSSSGSSGGSSSGSSSSTTTTTEKNPDGSTTTTTTNKTTGTVTETTKNTDGSTTTVETKKDGSVTETQKNADGTTGTVKTDAKGNITEVTVTVPSGAADTAAKNDKPVTLPIEVPAVTESKDAAEIDVDVPAKGATVEIPVIDVTPGTVVVIVNADGTETVVATTALTEDGVVVKLEKDATIKVVDNAKEFADVPATSWAKDAIAFASARGITGGTSAITFGPGLSCTRAQMVTFLWRAAGSPEPVGSSNSFADVSDDAYYAKAIQWAVENGITNGTSATNFSPDATCTRAQMATFLWRNAGALDPVGTTNPFEDVNADAYYAKAIQWAYEQEITSGTSATTFGTDADCTRAQMVTFLYRYFVK